MIEEYNKIVLNWPNFKQDYQQIVVKQAVYFVP